MRRIQRIAAVACLSSGLSIFPLVTSSAVAGSSPPLIAFSDNASGAFEVQPGAPQTVHLVAVAGEFPVFSPNGLQLGYEVAHGNGPGDPHETNSIVVASRLGSAPHTILTGSLQWNGPTDGVYYPLAWSPNGTELAYGCDGRQNVKGSLQYAEVCVVNVDTGAHHMLTNPATNTHPLVEAGYLTQRMSFTPDGKQIIADVLDPKPCQPGPFFVAGDRCGYPEVGVVDVATGSVNVLTHNYAQAPALSRDGRQIMFYHPSVGNEPASKFGLYLMDVGGSNQRQLISGVHLSVEPGAIFSPDGKDILYTGYSSQDAYHQQAFELPVSGSGTPKMYTQGGRDVFGASWTPLLTTCTVPKLKQKTLVQAKKLLRKAACSLGKVSGPKSHRGARHIVKQSPQAGREEPAGTRVSVRVK